MINAAAEALYLRLPVPIQNVVCSLEGWRIRHARYNKGFHNAVRQKKEHTFWSREQLVNYQNQQIHKLIRYCAQHVPYYRRKFCEWRVPVEHIRSIESLREYLPILTKSEVQEYFPEFVSEVIPHKSQRIAHTSGTTGAGLRFAIVQETNHQLWAFWWRYRHWHGLNLSRWCAHFGGRSIVAVKQHKPPFWRINYPGRQILFSAYHMSAIYLDSYLQKIQRSRVEWLHGYPSLLALLAEHALLKGFDLQSQIKWITTGAETLLPQQAKLIRKAFGIWPIQHYGQAEAVANISQCPAGNLHVDEDFSAVEFIPTGDGASYRIIGTGFINPATPLVRYDTQDLAVPEKANIVCSCGRQGRLIRQLDGRIEDYIILKNGARIGRMDHIFKDLIRIREAQIYQKEPGKVIFRIVRGKEYVHDDERQLIKESRIRLGEDTHIEITYVEKLERESSGKLRLVISEINKGQLCSVGK